MRKMPEWNDHQPPHPHDAAAHAALLVEYERLLTHRYRLLLAEPIQCIHSILARLMHAQHLLQATTSDRKTSASSGGSSSRAVQTKKDEAFRAIATRLRQLEGHIPTFLGERVGLLRL